MKKLLITLVLALIGVAASGQTVYSCDYKSDAQVKVYVTKYKSDADLVVYKTNYKSDADANKGIWYFVKYKSDAGWKNNSKKHLMY